LILVRHAKADKNNPSIKDVDRPLNRCGGRDAAVMAERMAALDLHVEALISSPALRAQMTAEAFAQKLQLPVQADERMYEGGMNELLAVVRNVNDRHSMIALVGHNPGLSEFLRYLTDENYADLPAAGIAVVELPLKSWRHTFEGKGVLKNRLAPKEETSGLRPGEPVLHWRDRYRIWQFEHAKQIYLTTAFVLVLLVILGVAGLALHQSTDPSAMPQQGSSSSR